jgi:hypothetical protein
MADGPFIDGFDEVGSPAGCKDVHRAGTTMTQHSGSQVVDSADTRGSATRESKKQIRDDPRKSATREIQEKDPRPSAQIRDS